MKQQIVIIYRIHTTVLQHETYVLMQLFTYLERMTQLFHKRCLLFCKSVWTGRIYCRKVVAFQLIFLIVYIYGSSVIINV